MDLGIDPIQCALREIRLIPANQATYVNRSVPQSRKSRKWHESLESHHTSRGNRTSRLSRGMTRVQQSSASDTFLLPSESKDSEKSRHEWMNLLQGHRKRFVQSEVRLRAIFIVVPPVGMTISWSNEVAIPL
jgi:hypothetical protein